VFADKSKTIYGESRSVPRDAFKEADMLKRIEAEIGNQAGLNLTAMREAWKKAKADPEMKDAYIKVGVVGQDLVWKIKSGKGLGKKVVSVILRKNYLKAVQEHDLEEVVKRRDQTARDRIFSLLERIQATLNGRGHPAWMTLNGLLNDLQHLVESLTDPVDSRFRDVAALYVRMCRLTLEACDTQVDVEENRKKRPAAQSAVARCVSNMQKIAAEAARNQDRDPAQVYRMVVAFDDLWAFCESAVVPKAYRI
jgi:hypothetical protein